MTARDVTAVLGPVDETLMAEVIRTGASRDDLVQAWAWVHGDEALISEVRPLPRGKVAELLDLLAPDEDEPEG